MADGDSLLTVKTVLAELEPNDRALFAQARRIERGCSILRFLNQRDRVLITVEDIAYHLEASRASVARDLQALMRLGLVSSVAVVGVVFFGLTEDEEMRRAVRRLCRWQDRWHRRLSELEDIVDGRATRGGSRRSARE